MKRTVCLVLAASGLAAVCLAGRNFDRWGIREQETIEKTLTLASAPMRVVVDNVDGYVHVTSTNGTQVHVTAHKVIRADSDSDLQQAKSEVKLQIEERPGSVWVSYDAPWRRCNGENGGCRDWERRFYNVTYDIDVQVPRGARPVISTVNNGDVRVDGTSGDFEVKNVNGGISMTGIAGAGEVHTVNGPVTVHFAANPQAPCSFKSINGTLNVYFRPSLSANLGFKTFNGQIYSDFEVSPRAIPAAQSEQRDGKFVYRSNGPKGGRAGQGGPELNFDTLNGDIRLHRAE